ncbi:MAG: hypothetical protein BGO20_09455 [Bosea sp. 67-29]|jgi:hypothetical protein|nr:MAG: hypothetical protein BGO20_09455 [Bosea sp. 67-29]
MIGTTQVWRANALERELIASLPRRRRGAPPHPDIRRRVSPARGATISIADGPLSDQLLDEEFDELGCELTTLLQMAAQL